MRQRRSWRKRSLGAVLGLMLGWLAAAYAPDVLNTISNATHASHPPSDTQPAADRPDKDTPSEN